MAESDAASERHLVAVVSDEPEHYRAIREHLGDTFRISHARDEDEIQKVFENADVHAVLFDLDCVGDGTADGLEVLEEMRRLRDDLVLAAFTRTTQRTLPLKAAQAGADEFFLVPLNFEELKIVLLRALEKRTLELEGRRVIAQAEQKVSFCGLVGGSAAMQKVYGSIEAHLDPDPVAPREESWGPVFFQWSHGQIASPRKPDRQFCTDKPQSKSPGTQFR